MVKIFTLEKQVINRWNSDLDIETLLASVICCNQLFKAKKNHAVIEPTIKKETLVL